MGLAQAIDQYAHDLPEEVQASVYHASKLKTEKRRAALEAHFANPDALRHAAGQVKQHALDHLAHYLEAAEEKLQANGAQVHWASTGTRANEIIRDIMQAHGAKRMVKSKSMVSEETELVPFLEKHGIEAVETDLGEFIVQIDGDHPSHIVTPIIHKNRQQVARSFEREGLGDYNDEPATITSRARTHLRQKYLSAEVGLTGGNFVVAESGRVVIVTNEGNARFSMAPVKVHIALIGIEKILPRDRDLGLMLNLLGRSATAQQLTVYTQFISGPRGPGRTDGPEQMHVVFLDNGRSRILGTEHRALLRCIRCGACLNVCPVYRQSSGHAYRGVYPGPIGAVLSPLLNEHRFPELADLPKASSLCGACNEVCPVEIPITEHLLRLRDRGKREGAKIAARGTPGLGLWAAIATTPYAWKTALRLGHVKNVLPDAFLNAAGPAARWQSSRKLPPFRGGSFRSWMKQHEPVKPGRLAPPQGKSDATGG